jgi:hypothetical protein
MSGKLEEAENAGDKRRRRWGRITHYGIASQRYKR